MFIPRLKLLGNWVIATAIFSFGFSVSVERFSFLPFQSINQAIAQNSLNTQQQKRIALVIGNANYQVENLVTPLNDATDMAKALEELGFEVILLKDSSKREMDEGLDRFSTLIKQGYVGLFYYAGHGIQIQQENYLIPVNAQIFTERDVQEQSIPLATILSEMANAGNQLNIVILDACRNNPFRSFSRSLSSSGGLATPAETASGTLIVFATAPGKVASNGRGLNGLFTSYLLKYIKTPNLDVDLMLRQVRSNVAKDTKNYQVPWNSSSLMGEFYFNQKAEITPQPQTSSSTQLTATAFYNSGVDKYKAGDYQGAISDYDQAIQLNPDYAEAYRYRGNSKDNLKDNQGAISDYDQVIKLNPDDAVAYYNRGNFKNNLGDNQGAIADYNQAIQLNPNYTVAYYNRGLAKYYLKDNQGAISDYDQVIKLNPDDAVVYYNRGNSKNNLGDYQGAISDYTQAIKLKPDYAEAYRYRGNSKNELKDNQGAISDYDQAIQLKPNYPYPYYLRGNSKSNLGDYKGAIVDYNQAIQLNFYFIEAYYSRGGSKNKLGDSQGAISDYNQAIKFKPDYADAYYNRGLLHKKLRDNPKAINDFRQATKLYQQQNNQTGYQNSLDKLKELGVSN
jgi:tetratricopeptide (TPR) repeat protein